MRGLIPDIAVDPVERATVTRMSAWTFLITTTGTVAGEVLVIIHFCQGYPVFAAIFTDPQYIWEKALTYNTSVN
jgi:hypothetical protein